MKRKIQMGGKVSKEYRREQYRRLYAKRDDGIDARKYTPEQWAQVEVLLTEDVYTAQEISELTGVGIATVYKIKSGYHAFGRRESLTEL